ncbi:MAG: hypothetical protein ABIG61_03255 [Planctomycetota bacterium]
MKYMFRRTLLEEHGQQAVVELVKYCRDHKIDSCMIVTESHDQHPFPRPLDKLADYCNSLLSFAIRSLKENGIEAGINVWFTLGCAAFDHDFQNHREFGWDNYVDWQGNRSKVAATPCSPKWQNYVRSAYRLFASTRPDYIFIDDDFRLHNHGFGYLGLGSFDELMLKRLSERIGKTVDRKRAVDLILKHHGRGSVREIWFQVQNEAMVEAARVIRRAVDSIDEKIPVGLMSSNPDVHSVEGRNWRQLIETLAGENQPLSRPMMGNYRQRDYKSLADAYFYVLGSISRLGHGVRYCAEIENAQGGLYGKSVTMLRAQMRLAILAGCQDLTLNLYDFVGQPLGENSFFDELLIQEKPLLTELEFSCRNTKHRGVQCITHPEAALSVSMPKTYGDLIVKSPWGSILGYLGVGAACEDEKVKAVSGDIVRITPVETLKEWFSSGVLLDGSAAFALDEMGLAEWTGVRVCGTRILLEHLGNEQIDSELLGPVRRRLSVRHIMGDSYAYLLEPITGALPQTTLWKDIDCGFGPGMIWFENQLGGRIATIAYDGQSDVFQLSANHSDTIAYYSSLRQLIMHRTLSFLSDDAIPVTVASGAYVMPIRLDDPGYTIIALQSFHSDDFEVEAIIRQLPQEVKAVHCLNKDGIWENYTNFDKTDNRLKITCTIAHGECRIFKIDY